MIEFPSESFSKDCEMYFSRLLNIPPAKPAMIIFDITHRCNLKCTICEIWKDGFDYKKEFTLHEVFDIIDQICEWGVKELVLSGGEAFIRPDIFEILDYAHGKLNVGILTSGTLISNNVLKRIEPYLKEGNVSLTISLDGITAETHDSIRGVDGVFKKTVALLQKLSMLKKDNPRVNFNVISIILNSNLEELEDILLFVKSLSANSIQFQPLLPNNLRLEKKINSPLWVPEERYAILDRIIDLLINYKKRYPEFIANNERDLFLVKKYFRNELTSEEVKCYAIFTTMLISMEGKITACGNSYGDIRRDKIYEAWRSSEAQDARNKIKMCNVPCLLPCFTNSRLYSLQSITAEFLQKVNALKKFEKEAEITKAIKILNFHKFQFESMKNCKNINEHN